MSNRPMSIKVIVTTSITYFMIFATSALAVDYVYEFFFTDITSTQNPVRYLTKYFICGLVFLYCMKESTLIDGKRRLLGPVIRPGMLVNTWHMDLDLLGV